MKGLLTILLLLIATTIVQAQNVVLNWAKQMGGTGSDKSNSVAVDAAGNVYTTGTFSGMADFDPGPGIYNLTAFGNFDMFVSKLDAAGNFIWAKQMGGTKNATGNEITMDAAENIYIAGSFSGTADFNPGAGVSNFTATGNSDIIVCRLDAAGNFAWAKQMGGNGLSTASSIALDVTGNLYITGLFGGTTDFDPGTGIFSLTSIKASDYFISKLSGAGNFLWAVQLGAEGNGGIASAVDVFGNVYTTGGFSGTTDFNPGAGVFNLTSFDAASDVFITKLDAAGNFVWAKQMSGPSYSDGYSIATDAAGYIYITGDFSGRIDFDPAVTVYNVNAYGDFDIFVCKLDPLGILIWAKQMGGAGLDEGMDITLDAAGNIYIVGQFSATADFDPLACTYNLSPLGSSDIFITKLDAAGLFKWAKQIGGTSDNLGLSIAADDKGNVYTTGYFRGIADFDPAVGVVTLNAAGNYDCFVHKMSYCTNSTTSTMTVSTCGVFIFNCNFYITSGVYTQVLENAGGCDSTITLYLTLNNTPFSTINQTICKGQNYAGYTTSGIYTDTLMASNGCDSIRTLHLTVLNDLAPDLGADRNLCPGDSLVLNPGQFSNYVWQDGSTKNTFTVKHQGLYSVTTTNNCGILTDDILVTENACEIRFPSAFTPNHDRKNESFKILGANNLSDFHLVVYNRWGQKVFESNNYAKGWDGNYKGQLQPPGIYIWYCTFKKANNPTLIAMKGTIALLP